MDWRDFELMVDLIFAASGWRRVSAVGGSEQADSDLILEQAATGERAFVQVKSAATPVVLHDYLDRFAASGLDRMFFVCHSPKGRLEAQQPGVHLWLGETLTEQAIKAGLFAWLIEKVR
nr:restriction endonuclease [Phenylobacterium sp.]